MTEPLSIISRASLALVLGLVLVSGTEVLAQGKLRGPAPAGGMPQLPPKPPINLLNNGSLATWPNPNAILPNQVQFAYIAAVPLGDRLGYNGIFYDQEIIPNVGLFTPGGMGGGVSPGPGPFPPPLFQAAQLARQRRVAVQAQQMQQMAFQAYLFRYQQAARALTSGKPTESFPGISSLPDKDARFDASWNGVPFGAGFQPGGR